jgi:lysophospholipase L1-like esterase
VWPAPADDRGEQRHAYTPDGLHLTGEGYAAWVQALRPHIDRMLPRV